MHPEHEAAQEAPAPVPAPVAAAPMPAGPAPSAQAVLRLSQTAGNAAVARALAGGAAGVQARVESVTGFDLSGAAIHPRSPAARAAGVDGLAHGRDVHLAPGVEPGTHHGDEVLAHELAHVVQQATGRRGGVATEEADADAVAARAATAGPARVAALAPLPAPRDLAVQLFDPRYHRTSTLQGLEGSGFTPDEMGMIYAANWERDLSQAHPALGNVILAWKEVKVAAFEKRLTEGDIAHFQGSCQTVLETALSTLMTTGSMDAFLDATAYGGYQFYEHMDNPEGTPQAAQMKVVLGAKNTSGLPDHMYISREYVKEMLFEAARLSHPDLAGTPTAAVAASSKATRDALGPGPGKPDPTGIPADAVAQETSLEAQNKAGGPAGGGGATLDPQAYALIGRASHALQDFWSHSNFVERAIGDPDFQLGGLTTATFGADDKKHALAHKIRGAADEIAAEMPLIDRMAGRTAKDPDPSEVHVGDEDPVHHEDDEQDKLDALMQAGSVLGALPGNAIRSFQRGYDRGSAASGGSRFDRIALGILGGLEGAAMGTVASVAGSRGGVYALRRLAEKIEEDTKHTQQATGDMKAHGLLAKDQPGHEDDVFGKLKTAKFELAHALSVAADKQVAGKMKAVAEAGTAAEADARLQEIFTAIDALVADAVPGHPLWSIVEAHRAAAQEALNAYLASKPGAGDLAPTGPRTSAPV